MKIPLLLLQIWPLFKFEVIRAFNFVKSNDVAKLFLLICITMNSSKLTADVVNDYLILTELSVKAVSLVLSFFVFVGMMITLYYLSFNLKKTIYQMPKKYYIFFISVNSIKLLMTFCTPNNFIAIISFEVFYIFVMSAFVFDLYEKSQKNINIYYYFYQFDPC